MKAWHFLREDKKMGYKDGRLVRVGHTFKCDPDSIELCKFGFHASINPMDAIYYAPGPVACRVELGGRIIKGGDKVVASERTVIAMADVSNALHEMACWSAERALKRIKNPDPRSIKAIEVKRKWVKGEASDKELGDAWAAARAAAWAASRGAVWDASQAADWAASRDASQAADWAASLDAAWNASRAASRGASGDAARAAERKAQSRKLTKLLNQELGL